MTSFSATPSLIALGSNVGDRFLNLQAAIDQLRNLGKLSIVSRVIESKAMYKTDQEPFLNAVAALETSLPPALLLKELKSIEKQLGRIVRERNGPREIDLDLLAYGQLRYFHGEELIVPHPRMKERPFVLIPLAEIVPDFMIPGLGTPKELLEITEDPWDGVQYYKYGDLSL